MAIIAGSKLALKVGKILEPRRYARMPLINTLLRTNLSLENRTTFYYIQIRKQFLTYQALTKIPLPLNTNYYSKIDLIIFKRQTLRRIGKQMTCRHSDRREKKPFKDDLIDTSSDDDSMFDHSVFESPEPLIDDFQNSPAAS